MAPADEDGEPNPEIDHPQPVNTRSCLECRRRKIRCDKKQPCGYCTRVRMRCIYPRPNQSTRSAMADQDLDTLSKLRQLETYVYRLEDRIARLEGKGTTAEIGTDRPSQGKKYDTSLSAVQESTPDVPLAAGLDNLDAEHGDQVTRNDQIDPSHSSHAQDVLMHEERSILVTRNDVQLLKGMENGFAFWNFPMSGNLQRLHPQPHKIFVLWQIFLENVDPLIKIFHAPTTQAQIIHASRDMSNVTPVFESLMFSTYYAAVVSLGCDDRCREMLGEEKAVLLQKFKLGCEMSLANARVMSQPNLVSLQALALYLVCGRRDLNESYVCSMTAAAIRIATKLGLNKDPELQSYSPFHCEIRRRLWWMLVTLECRSAEDNDQDSLIFDSQFNTKFPSNINDGDMDIYMSSAPCKAAGYSEMLFTNVRFEVGAAARKITFSSNFARDNGYPVLDAKEKFDFLDSLWGHVEQKYYMHCDPCIPLCFTSMAATKMVLARLKLMLYHPSKSEHLALQGEALQTLVKTSIDIMEHMHSLRSDTRYQKWVWLFQKYVEWDAAAFVLLSLNVKSVASDMDEDVEMRAWKAVDIFFKTWNGRVDPNIQEKWRRLTMLKKRAERQQKSDISANYPGTLTSLNDFKAREKTGENVDASVRLSADGLVTSQERHQGDIDQDGDNSSSQTTTEPVKITSSADYNDQQASTAINPHPQELPASFSADGPQVIEREWKSLEQALKNDGFSWPMDIEGHAFDGWL